MKRFVLLAAVAAACVPGCADDAGTPMNNPFGKKKPAAASTAPNYFEVKKGGKTYVLASQASLQAFNKGGSVSFKEMPNYGPKGETVAFENSGFTESNRLIAEYRKSHSLP